MSSDPTYNINVSGDIKQMLKELGTEKGKEIALHRGGGNKAQKSIHVTVFCTIVSLQEEDDEQDKIGSWYNNAGKGASASGSATAIAKKRKLGVAMGEFKDFSSCVKVPSKGQHLDATLICAIWRAKNMPKKLVVQVQAKAQSMVQDSPWHAMKQPMSTTS
ncbi:hypothetical protein TEA_000741 [Camellia sinensis var. sinensis]|uniref:Uncharacterized protein n=1 Tax=Camellia sinensis var. sinensis TaxID=542762 RepID=A0A4S4EEK6_CAMSN|nr:hypothetical protein TEA_000741 [Camellia sinensis var. sinensis]